MIDARIDLFDISSSFADEETSKLLRTETNNSSMLSTSFVKAITYVNGCLYYVTHIFSRAFKFIFLIIMFLVIVVVIKIIQLLRAK